MTKKKFSLFIILTITLLSISKRVMSADAEKLDDYYREVFMGEKKTQNYSGALDPRGTFNDYTAHLTFLDDTFSERYLNQQIQEESFDLHRYWFNEVVEKSACPDSTLSENIDYIRYLYRLVSMSYLFEGLKLNHKLANELGGKNSCSINFKDVFGSCEPESTDMKKFHQRIYAKFLNEYDKIKISPISKKETATWFNAFQDSTSLTTDPTFSRLHEWCIAHKKNCRNLKLEEIKEALSGFCESDTKMIGLLCREKDSFYGYSLVSTPTELIRNSNAFNLINQSGMGEECLRRYGKLFQAKEANYGVLGRQYPLLYSYLLKNNSRYPQGELFLPGALKEFDMKGLSDFLSALKPPKVEPVKIVIKKKAVPKPKPIVVETPKVIEKAPEAPAPVIIEPPKPVLSEFEKGLVTMKEKDQATLWLDMEAFREGFEFTQGMIAELSGPIKKFQTREALSDMKAYDTLGSSEAPIGLVFLKFLIDTDNHQGLYNIITVIGDKFYVMNDIEKKNTPHYMQLKNDSSTKNQWQIILLKK